MKTCLYLLLTFCTLLATSSCDKPIGNAEDDPNPKKEQSNTGNDSTQNDNSGYGSKIEKTWGLKAMTVAEAQQAQQGVRVLVKAYVVGTAYRSLANSTFHPPFETQSSILLADFDIHDSDTFAQEISAGDLLPVCLNDIASWKKQLNLVDNPSLWNKRIYIVGTLGTYFNTVGLRRVAEFEAIP